MSFRLYETEWENWSPNFQKFVIILLNLVQKPRYLSGLGLLKCDLDTFSQVDNILPF